MLILKVLGIIILTVFSLTLAIIALVLFMPVKWKADGKKNGSIEFCAEASWLIRMLSLRFAIDASGSHLFFKIFGREPGKPKSGKTRIKNGASGNEKRSKPLKKKTADIESDCPDAENRKDSSAKNEAKGEKDDSGQKKSLEQRINGLREKWSAYSDYPYKKELMDEAMLLLARLLKAVAPKKIIGRILFGFDDPSLTGAALGMLHLIAAFMKVSRSFAIEADFEKKTLVFNIHAAGRIYIWSLLWPLLAIAASKPGWFIIKPMIFKKRKDGSRERQLEQQF
ncbi:MAG: hypothetical protein LBU32_23290 [Clostridiales bacterium]|nr:hypothetical protein [Clostridiales bacterium]